MCSDFSWVQVLEGAVLGDVSDFGACVKAHLTINVRMCHVVVTLTLKDLLGCRMMRGLSLKTVGTA